MASLRPETAAEGQLAAQFVLAGERRRETDVSLKCKAQALSFMREAKSALRVAWAEHTVAGWMRMG